MIKPIKIPDERERFFNPDFGGGGQNAGSVDLIGEDIERAEALLESHIRAEVGWTILGYHKCGNGVIQ